MLIYTLLFSAFGFYNIGKVQWFKTSVWVDMLISIVISIKIAEYLNFRIINFFIKHISLFSIILIAIISFLIMNSALIPIKKMQTRYMIANYRKTDLTLMHEWIASNTDKNAVFLTFPDDYNFLSEAKRSLIIGYKAMLIHNPKFMINWYNVYKDIYGLDINNVKQINFYLFQTNEYEIKAKELYQKRNVKKIFFDKYKIDYRIDNINLCQYKKQLGTIIHREGDYILSRY
jgi:hypothetical protein